MEDSRKLIRNILLAKGIDPILTQMPAIIERINAEYKTKSKEEIIRELEVSNNGKNIVVGNKYLYMEQEDGSVQVKETLDKENQSHEILIDRYGMDVSEVYDDLFLSSSVCRKEDGTIALGSKTNSDLVIEDSGECILNYQNYTILKNSSNEVHGWEENRKNLTAQYPLTKGWFSKKEKQIKGNEIEEEKDEFEIPELSKEDLLEINQIQKLIIGNLEKDNVSLMEKVKEMRENQKGLLNKINVLLTFANKVRNSRVGKLFFRNQIKSLPAGNEYER